MFIVRSRSIADDAITAERAKLDKEIADTKAKSRQVISEQIAERPSAG